MITRRIIVFVTAAAFFCLSCSSVVNVPFDPEPNVAVPLHPAPSIMKGTYRVTTMDGVQHGTRDLVVKPDSVMFTAEKRYELARADVRKIERIEVDGAKTAVAVVIAAFVLFAGLYALAQSIEISAY